MRKRYHTLIDGVYYSSDKSKAEYVYDKEYGIGYGFVYSVEYGKRAVKVGADIEHIEFVRHAAFKENIDRVWDSIPKELRGDLTKEEFLKSMTQEKLKKYIDGEIKKLTPDEKKEGDK